MKLNIDCIRNVLLELEKLPLGKVTFVSTLYEVLDYPESDILYSCVKLQEAGYIITVDIYRDCNYMPHIDGIIDITFKGHEFLSNIKIPSVWEKLSETLKKIPGASLSVISEIGKALAIDVIKSLSGIK